MMIGGLQALATVLGAISPVLAIAFAARRTAVRDGYYPRKDA